VQKDVQLTVVGKPVIVMENLNGIRQNFKNSKKLNRRFHSLPFRRLQTIVEYKPLIEAIEVKYPTRKETRGTSKTYHKCRHVAQVKGREFRCPRCGLTYNGDLNACINIAHALTRGMRWRSREPLKPADEAEGVKPQLNAGSPQAFSREQLTSFNQVYDRVPGLTRIKPDTI
jgi:IS605 OrfB family transposase